MCTRTHTHIHTTALFFLWLSAARLHYTLNIAPLPASLSFQMSYVRHPALRDKDRNSVSKWDLATSKLSSDSCRKGAWGGSTMQWQGRRETPPPTFMITVKIDVQWVYEIPLFAFVLLGGWNIPLCSCHTEDWMIRHHILHPNSCAIMYEWCFCHYLQKNMWNLWNVSF